MAEPTDEQKKEAAAKLQMELDTEYSVVFKKREWVLIYNILTSVTYKLGDATLVLPIVEKVARDADLLQKPQPVAKPAAAPEKPADKVLTN
ncbi:MAG: hypothetical protein KGJ89_05390 [Patescibacteria group bacterium]|nr:hypothetical protein [Patescibacteria group bacterium]MDE2015866.1 hypothetical protein [Patescibacteria group bacterium]MDE2227355.1 hypothetical protein [Patescibacteria group bacterium]